MMGLKRRSSGRQRFSARGHRARPQVEGLEDRRLLYATLGANWVYPYKITFSFVPDGTMVAGVPSTLFQTLDAKFPREVWQREFQAAAATWQAFANINLVEVPDYGGNLDVYGNQQGDPRFGDIRISAIPLAFGTMGAAFSPPPINGGTVAGDVVINSIMDWKINSNWDLRTVAIHEIGHALGMSHSTIGAAAMFSYYTVMKQTLNADDKTGIQSIYQARQPDWWNSNGQSNTMWETTKSLDGWLSFQNQIQMPWLNLHQSGMTEWFWATVPNDNISGRIVAQMQSTGFSLLSPRLEVYDWAMNFRGEATSSKFGDTITVTVPGVSKGQGFYFKMSGGGGGTVTGMYGLQINFGSTPLIPLTPAYPAVLWQPNAGGGLASMRVEGEDHVDVQLLKLGELVGWGDTLEAPGGGHAPEYLAALDESARRLDALATNSILVGAAVDPSMPTTIEDVLPAISPERVVSVPSTAPATPSAPFRSWRGWALDVDRDRPALGAKRLVGSLGAL